jgi:acetyl-CoA acetyltransferase
MASRNPIKDQVAIVGIGSTEYSRNSGRTPLGMGLEAAKKAIQDAGIDKQEINGIIGFGAGNGSHTLGGTNFLALQEGLGIGRVTWTENSWLGMSAMVAAVAVFSGMCETALVVQGHVRTAGWSSDAQKDRMRMRAIDLLGSGHGLGGFEQRWIHQGEPYGAWASRYLFEFGVPRDVYGMIAVNNRRNASLNENAIMRSPITMDDYLSSRMIYDPLCLLDCDVPADCAEALVITTAERARDLPNKPVYIHAMSSGQSEHGLEYYENKRSYLETAPWISMAELWARSDLQVTDMDLFFPYDGFSTLAVCYLEAAGFCGPGEAFDYMKSNWDAQEDRLRLNGRTIVSSNGGSLSHGRSGGMNYIAESVRQLRGEAGVRQVPDAKTSLVGIGSFYHDPAVSVLRVD